MTPSLGQSLKEVMGFCRVSLALGGREEFLALDALDVGARRFFIGRNVLDTGGCLVTALASTLDASGTFFFPYVVHVVLEGLCEIVPQLKPTGIEQLGKVLMAAFTPGKV